MTNNYLGLLALFLLLTLPIFSIHYLIFEYTLLNESQETFYYSIPFLYLFFFIFSAISLFFVLKITQKNFDSTGMTFMLATTIQTITAFILARPILNNTLSTTIEKSNFFFIFILFLIIETVFSIKILNKK
tara:strand:+ start:259 stop:651 length:393 start_codon:yes stop_codon:yes gene_type:complete